MSFLQNRHEQLAAHLREQIQRGQLTEPLPDTRTWANRLGVSCTTLYAALHTLQREELISIQPRAGIRLSHPRAPRVASGGARVVRLIYRSTDYPESFSHPHWCGLLSEQLQTHGIQLTVERCTDIRLTELSRAPAGAAYAPRELLFLRSLSEKYQQRFSRSGRPSLIVGYRAPQVALPFVTSDLEGAIRHATHALLRRGLTQLHFLINRAQMHAVQRQCAAFVAACAAWPRQPVQAEAVRVPLLPAEQIVALRRFAARIRRGHGILVTVPVSAAAVMTTLLARQIAIPEQAEVVVINSMPDAAVLWPPPTQYRVSLDTLVKSLTRVAVHFFETGAVPQIAKVLPMEMVKPDVTLAGSGARLP
ncbi:MAG: GntR family transcriptional regulator [Verrucomicrobiae bacterium]|nr:GntR family transcriptional regulator [Verrucomicrobiae bacterium]